MYCLSTGDIYLLLFENGILNGQCTLLPYSKTIVFVVLFKDN